jgi:acyl-coenzyme A synthetase/AMP-(fatty) acid ligase
VLPTQQWLLWLGRPGLLKLEVAELWSVLSEVGEGRASVSLATEPLADFDWVGERPYRHRVLSDDGSEGGQLRIRTSGTTGTPSWVVKKVADVLGDRGSRVTSQDRWLLCYSPARWAGLSVMAHTLRTRSELVVPDSLEVMDILAALPYCTSLSLTPSLFRKLSIAGGRRLGATSVQQVTFGGEYASQGVLDAAQRTWPAARVSHVYATTEHGDICAVSDGLEGIPITALRDRPWMLEQGELVLGSQRTRDLWELKEGRLYYAGRVDDVVNVGGNKVRVGVVERECLTVAGVQECRAFGVASPVLGQVVCLEYVGDVDSQTVQRELATRLPRYAVPVRVVCVPELPRTEAGKVVRR